jgi:hypothetical protein
MGEKAPEFPEKLGRQGFVMAYDEGGHLDRLDKFGHGKGLPRPGYPLEGLILIPRLDARCQGRNGLSLIPRGAEGGDYLKGTHALSIPGNVVLRKGRADKGKGI